MEIGYAAAESDCKSCPVDKPRQEDSPDLGRRVSAALTSCDHWVILGGYTPLGGKLLPIRDF